MFRPVLQGAELCPAGRRAQCNCVLVQKGAEGMCVDGRVPAGIFVSEGPVDQWKRGSEPYRRLCFLGSEMSVGVLRIWSVSWRQLRSEVVAQSLGEHRQMLLAESTREFFLTWQRALLPATLMSAILTWPRFSLAQLEPRVLGLWCLASPALPWLVELVCQAQLWTSVNDHACSSKDSFQAPSRKLCGGVQPLPLKPSCLLAQAQAEEMLGCGRLWVGK